jgi:hypothetical protein
VSKFKRLVNALVAKGRSEESARRIAYSVGVKKYGKRAMARKAAAGRKAAG